MLYAFCASSAHSTEKPIASAISPQEAMTKVKSAFADPAKPWMTPFINPKKQTVQSGDAFEDIAF
jgi:hypothetical protein